jgi:hypothetical protein
MGLLIWFIKIKQFEMGVPNKNIKIIIGIFGVAVVGVGGYYLYLKSKTKKDTKVLTDTINKTTPTTANTPASTTQSATTTASTATSTQSSASDYLLDVNDIGVSASSSNGASTTDTTPQSPESLYVLLMNEKYGEGQW